MYMYIIIHKHIYIIHLCYSSNERKLQEYYTAVVFIIQ